MAKTINTFSPKIPYIDAWPYIRAYSSRYIVYYSPSDEATLPIQDQRFWKIVGRKIKALGMVLTKSGCHFVPQSEGQFFTSPDLKELWNSIKTEEKLIRKAGLELTNFETGETILFQNNEYRSPWTSFEDFEADIVPKARMGCIFVLVPHNLQNICSKMKDEPLSTSYTHIELIYDLVEASDPQGRSQSFSLFRITVNCDQEGQIENEWIVVTNYIYDLLKSVIAI